MRFIVRFEMSVYKADKKWQIDLSTLNRVLSTRMMRCLYFGNVMLGIIIHHIQDYSGPIRAAE
jgi:hypothetical protein